MRFPFCLLLALAAPAAPEGDGAADDDIPVVGRPADLPFSGASGWFNVRASAAPTEVPVGGPVAFTLTVRAVDPKRVRHPPARIDLTEVPEVAERFFVEDAAEPERHAEGSAAWEFAYTLKPRGRDVTEIPGVPFVFYNPILGVTRGFQVAYTDAIPLTVGRERRVAVPLHAPEQFLQLAEGTDPLATVAPERPLSAAVVALLLALPPAAGVAFYAGWRRLRPDVAALARRRRGRAARRALRDLNRVGRPAERERAGRVVGVLADYLRARLDLPGGEPTPARVTAHLRGRGLPADLVARVGDFLADCDAARFGPVVPPGDPGENAARLVLDLEASA